MVFRTGRDAVEEAQEQCERDAEALALQRYNDTHETDYSSEDFRSNCWSGEQCPEPLPQEVYDEVEELIRQAANDLDCSLYNMPQIVENPEKERISVIISPDVHPGW